MPPPYELGSTMSGCSRKHFRYFSRPGRVPWRRANESRSPSLGEYITTVPRGARQEGRRPRPGPGGDCGGGGGTGGIWGHCRGGRGGRGGLRTLRARKPANEFRRMSSRRSSFAGTHLPEHCFVPLVGGALAPERRAERVCCARAEQVRRSAGKQWEKDPKLKSLNRHL